MFKTSSSNVGPQWLQAPPRPAHSPAVGCQPSAAPARRQATMSGKKLSPSKRTRDGAPLGGQRRISDMMGATKRVSGLPGRRRRRRRRAAGPACHRLAPAASCPTRP